MPKTWQYAYPYHIRTDTTLAEAGAVIKGRSDYIMLTINHNFIQLTMAHQTQCVSGLLRNKMHMTHTPMNIKQTVDKAEMYHRLLLCNNRLAHIVRPKYQCDATITTHSHY